MKILLFTFIAFANANCSCTCDETRMIKFGQNTWNFLHTIATKYPTKPNVHDKQNIIGFMNTLASTYPCVRCRNHLKQNLNTYGYHVNNRTDISIWLCFLHNKVNEKTSKYIYDCNINKLDKMYLL